MYSCSSSDADVASREKRGKNIIFMVPDGMGLSNVTIARTYKNGINGDKLNFEKLPFIGYQRTHSRNSTVTDSAAAGSAWAAGEKFNNGEISCLDENDDGVCDGTRINAKTVLELAKDKGMSTGLVATSTVTHATPAVWGAHVHYRYCETEIFRQFIEESEVDVILGGGIGKNRPDRGCAFAETDADYITDTAIPNAQAMGYAYVTTKDELANVGDVDKLLGLFSEYGITSGMTEEYIKSAASTEPTLAEMTTAALNVLEKNPEGFFLMVEGSQIDWANHARNATYQIKETLAFDDAVKVALDWMNEDDLRYDNTLLVVVADHETGGVIIDGPYGSLSQAGDTAVQSVDLEGDLEFDNDGNPVMTPDLDVLFGSNPAEPTESANHTAVDTVIWSNYSLCAKAMDNTDLYYIMADYIE